MNIQEAAELIYQKKANRRMGLIELKTLAKKSCSKCYGRGYTGIYKTSWNREPNNYDGELIPCSCVVNKIRAIKKQEIMEGTFR